MRPVKYGAVPPPSGGSLSKPIGGLGKLTTGTHTLEVLSATRTSANAWLVILQNSRRECHTETLEHWLPEWVPGTSVRATVGLTPGFIVYKTVGGFQARDAQTLDPLTGVLPDAGAVYLAVRPVQPASTCLTEVTDGAGRRLDARVHSSPHGQADAPT